MLKRAAYVFSVNVAVFVLLLLLANFGSAVILDLRRVALTVAATDQASLPNYSGNPLARAIFREFNALRGRYQPYVGWTRREFHGATTNIGSDGDRMHKATTDRPQHTARFFGGSTMWGTGAVDDGTIPAHFNQLFRDFRVLNHGETAFVSRQSLSRLINLANRKKPLDLVVFYDGVNDVAYGCRPDVGLNGHARVADMARRLDGYRTHEFLVGHLALLLDRVANKARVMLQGEDIVPAPCQEDPVYARQVADLLIENWKIAHEIVTARQGRFLAVLQPVYYLGNPERDHLGLSLTSRQAKDYRAVYPLIRRRIAELGVNWILDFTDAFDGEQPTYIDFAHVSENGNRIIAERLAAVVRERQIAEGIWDASYPEAAVGAGPGP